MTTIACDGKTVAADGLGTTGNQPTDWNGVKITRHGGLVYGYVGSSCYRTPFIEWHLRGRDPDLLPRFHDEDEGHIIVFYIDRCEIYGKNRPYPTVHPYPASFGSGEDFARMAMECGLSAEEAVRRTMKFDLKTGGEITVLPLVESAADMALLQAAE